MKSKLFSEVLSAANDVLAHARGKKRLKTTRVAKEKKKRIGGQPVGPGRTR
jgi:hypothetical protein